MTLCDAYREWMHSSKWLKGKHFDVELFPILFILSQCYRQKSWDNRTLTFWGEAAQTKKRYVLVKKIKHH